MIYVIVHFVAVTTTAEAKMDCCARSGAISDKHAHEFMVKVIVKRLLVLLVDKDIITKFIVQVN